MDDEMFITHLLSSLPQTEYEGCYKRQAQERSGASRN